MNTIRGAQKRNIKTCALVWLAVVQGQDVVQGQEVLQGQDVARRWQNRHTDV